MNGEQKITGRHRNRSAVVYIRQSTLVQVRDHTESTARQYDLAQLAVQLGWAASDVVIVDQDLGVSGTFGKARSGFRELVSRVCLGGVGAVFGLEVSRLARSSAEFSRLLELARLTDTLVIDTDGVYDLSDVNDRLLLGVKGTLSEAELHLIMSRLHGAKLAAAGRGELRFPLPIGPHPAATRPAGPGPGCATVRRSARPFRVRAKRFARPCGSLRNGRAAPFRLGVGTGGPFCFLLPSAASGGLPGVRRRRGRPG